MTARARAPRRRGRRSDDPSDARTLAEAIRAKANELYASNDNRGAVEHHDRALALLEGTGDQTQIARTLSASIQPLILLGEYERAFAAAARARELFVAVGNPWRLARMEVNEGNIYHRLDRFDEALTCYRRAYGPLVEHEDVEAAAAALSNMASCLVSLGDHRRALETHLEVRSLCERRGMPEVIALADYNLAYLHFLRGEYNRAIEALQRSRSAGEALGDLYQCALCQMDLAEIYLELNLAAEATEVAALAHQRFEQLGMGYEAARSLTWRAIGSSQQGSPARALELLVEARAAFTRERNAVWMALLDLYRAVILFHQRQWSESRRLCVAALEFFEPSLQPGKAVVCHLLLARLHLAAAQPGLAADECAVALGRLEELDSPALSFQAHLLQGQILLERGEREAAFASFQAAREALETLRANLRSEELKIAFVENRLEVYEHLVELCLERRGLYHAFLDDDLGAEDGAGAAEAFAYMEQAKSRSLVDLVLQPVQSLSSMGEGSSDAVRAIRSSREELNWYYSLIEREQLRSQLRSAEHIAGLERRARELERGLVRQLRELPQEDAEYATLQSQSTVPVDAIREALPAGAMLVEYFRIQDRFVVALLARDSLEIRTLGRVSRVGELLRLLRFQLSKFRLGPDYVRGFEGHLLEAATFHLHELYSELIAPVRDRLRAQHVVFVPHDLLHHVPLHALFDGERHLIDSFAVSYAPSASLYALCHAKQASTSGGSLVLGVPDPRAPSIAEEVRTVASVLPRAELYLGADATAQVLRSKGPSTRILHLATHGHFRHDNPMFSGIRLGDGYLSLYDFYGLKLPAELATLSGCATGVGVVSAGDEVRGLVRGLIYAGVRSMLLTLWDVNDGSTAELMAEFYRRFVRDGDPAAALRQAMLELRSRYPHPYHWAPFTLTGKVFAS